MRICQNGLLTGNVIVDNFTVHPDRTDLANNQTFIELADAEFAANKSGPSRINLSLAAVSMQ